MLKLSSRLVTLALTTLLLVSGCGSGSADDDAGARGAGYPVTIAHAFGETRLTEKPERIVVVGYKEQDYYLALGTVPVAIREWFGEQPHATWSWAQPYLDGAEPEVLPRAELNYESILGLQPDVIVGVSAGLTEEEYTELSKIAPTIAQPSQDDSWAATWQEMMRIAGQVVGKVDEAEEMIADLEQRIAGVASDYPELVGASAVFASGTEGTFYLYSPETTASRVLRSFGLAMSDEVANLTDNADQFFEVSRERLDLFDTDVAVWSEGLDEPTIRTLLADPIYSQLPVHQQRRDMFLGQEANGAFVFASVLSLPYVLDTIVPALAAAVDGDPATSSEFSASAS